MANPIEEVFSLVSAKYKKARLEYLLANRDFEVIKHVSHILERLDPKAVKRICSSGSRFYSYSTLTEAVMNSHSKHKRLV